MTSNKDTKVLAVVGMGPGTEEMMTGQALQALDDADVIVGYQVYLDQLSERYTDKKQLSTPMKKEELRCRMAFEEAAKDQKVVMLCSGDAGVYGMASLMYEVGRDFPGYSVEVIPGITAANSGAAVLGAPLCNDYCVVSLSDLLTPWDKIEKRIRAAASADFAMAIYNPSSKKRADYLQKVCDIMMEYIPGDRPCGFVKNIGRQGCTMEVMTLAELRDTQVDMFTTVFIGSEETQVIDGHMVTRRGYHSKKDSQISE